jgi:hypothetical protein
LIAIVDIRELDGESLLRSASLDEGERAVILSLIVARFGAVPAWASQRIESLAAPELEQLAPRLLDAGSLEDLLG